MGTHAPMYMYIHRTTRDYSTVVHVRITIRDWYNSGKMVLCRTVVGNVGHNIWLT